MYRILKVYRKYLCMFQFENFVFVFNIVVDCYGFSEGIIICFLVLVQRVVVQESIL